VPFSGNLRGLFNLNAAYLHHKIYIYGKKPRLVSPLVSDRRGLGKEVKLKGELILSLQ